MNNKTDNAGPSNSGSGMLMFHPSDALTLYKCYMPFLKNGGLYIPTTAEHKIGKKMFVVARLPNTDERLPIVGEVVWVNTSKSVTRPPGVGIQFADSPENTMVCEKIEKAIIGISKELQTYTM